jgi:chemotaxis protein histidine kinase CheA
VKEDPLGRKLAQDTSAGPPPGSDQTIPGLALNTKAAKRNAKRAAVKKMARAQADDSDTNVNFELFDNRPGADLPIIMEGPEGPEELMPGAKKFISDPEHFRRLCGTYFDTDDDDDEYEGSDGEEEDHPEQVLQQQPAGPGAVRVLHAKEKDEEEQSLEELSTLGKLGPKVWLSETLRKGYAPPCQVDDGTGNWEEVGGKKQQKPAAAPPPVPAAGSTPRGTAGFGAPPKPGTPPVQPAGGWGAEPSPAPHGWDSPAEPSAADGWGAEPAEPDSNQDPELEQAIKLSLELEAAARAARPSDSEDEQMHLAIEASRQLAEKERMQQEALIAEYRAQREKEARRRAEAEEQRRQQAAAEAARVAAAEAARNAQLEEYARHQAAMEQARLQAQAASAAAAAAAHEARRMEVAKQQEYARQLAAAAAFQAQLEEQARLQAVQQQQVQAAWYAHVQAQQPGWQQQQLAAVTAEKVSWMRGAASHGAGDEADDVDVDELAQLLING